MSKGLSTDVKKCWPFEILYRWWYYTFRVRFSYDRTFHEPRLIYWITYMKSSAFESVQWNEPNHVIIEFPERTSDCQEPKTFKKISHKKHIAIPITRGRDKRLTMPKGFGAFMMNQCAVLWCGRALWVATAYSHLPCFALCRKRVWSLNGGCPNVGCGLKFHNFVACR